MAFALRSSALVGTSVPTASTNSRGAHIIRIARASSRLRFFFFFFQRAIFSFERENLVSRKNAGDDDACVRFTREASARATVLNDTVRVDYVFLETSRVRGSHRSNISARGGVNAEENRG